MSREHDQVQRGGAGTPLANLNGMSEKKRQKKDGGDPSTANRRARKRPGSNDRVQNAVPRQSARDTSNFTDTEAGASDRVRLRRAPRPAATRRKGAGLSRTALTSSSPRAAQAKAGRGGKGK
jgi:hypothetical protein